MTKKIFWTLWLLAPLAVLAWHLGPGQTVLNQEIAGLHIQHASAAAKGEDWEVVVASLTAAQKHWPEGSSNERWRLELAEANAQIQSGNLIPGQEQMTSLLEEMENDPTADPMLQAAVRSDLATSSYYAAWMMRLEGAETEEWKQEAERARQQFRILAENLEDEQQQLVAAQNLEATIRLEQMDLATLMARPLPKNCCSNCNNLCQKKRKQCASRCKGNDGKKEDDKKKQGQQPKDARKEIKKTNSAGLHSGEVYGS